MANIIIPQITIVDPTGAFPSAFAPGETIILQRGPTGLVQAIYNYSGGAAPLPEKLFNIPSGNIAETRALAILSSARTLTFV